MPNYNDLDKSKWSVNIFGTDIRLLRNYGLCVEHENYVIKVTHKLGVNEHRIIEFSVKRDLYTIWNSRFEFRGFAITPISFDGGPFRFSCDEFFNWRIDHYTPSSIPTPESPP